MSRLFLRFTGPVTRTEDGFDAAIDWLVRAPDGSTEAEGHTDAAGLREVVETIAAWANDPDNVVVFVPVEDVLSASCVVPGRSGAQIRRAVPYAVEEFVAGDIDTMQVACAEPVRNEPVRCLVAPRTNVEDWLACVVDAGIQPGFLSADAMALAEDDNQVSVCFEGESVLIRAAEQIARVDRPNLGYILDGLLAGIRENEQEPSLRMINGSVEDLHGTATTVEVEQIEVETSMLGFLASEFDGCAVNLLQGDYAVRRRARGVWSRWQPVAMAAGMFLMVGVGILAAQGFWADFQAKRFRAEAVELYRSLYNVDRVAGNPAARMRRLLGQTPASDTGFHQLTGQLGVGLSNIPGRYELRGLAYSPRRGLDADLLVPNDAVLENLGAALRRQGLNMEVISTDSAESGGRIGARLRVATR